MEQEMVEGGLAEPEQFEAEPGSLSLLLDGDQHDRTGWERAAAGVLRKMRRLTDDDADAAVWEKLSRRSLDGIVVAPLGTVDLLDGSASGDRPDRAGDWDIRAHLDHADPADANEAVLTDLANGATSLWVTVGPNADLRTLLDGVLLDLAPVVLDARSERAGSKQAGSKQAGADQVGAATAFLALLGDTIPASGTNLGGDGNALVEVARLALDAGVLGVVVDATAVHDQGASDAQELAYGLAVGAAYLRELGAAGFALDDALGLIEFRYAATDEQFPTIAKLRAARRLWTRVVELSGGTVIRQRQHVVTSRPMMSRYDPWTNMLRTTVAAFAAGVGGADAVTVLPFDSALGVPDAFGRRIARNTSSLLLAEAHVARVADPAGGSYAVEKLTHDLATAAWAEFARIERTGLDALGRRIAEVAARRDDEIARRTRPLTGVSEFPNLDEALPERDTLRGGGARVVRPYGAAFEAMRDDPAARAVFLATMGQASAHTARASFAGNLFAAGGVAVAVAGPTDGVAEVLAVYDGQPVVCLAGTDTAYAGWGAELVAALRGAGAERVVLAGRAGVLTGSITDDLVDDACAAGDDALGFLARTREALA